MKKIIVLIAVFVFGILIGTLSTIAIKQNIAPTTTYILDCQTCTISPDDVMGYDVYSSSSAVTAAGKYTVRLVPMSMVSDRATIAYSFDDKTMQYGIVASVDKNDNGDLVFLIPDGDSYLSVTEHEFRGIIED